MARSLIVRPVMSTKAKEAASFSSQLSKAASDLTLQGEELLERVLKSRKLARKSVSRWKSGMRELVGNNPGKAMIGAFAVGFLLAKVARHV